MMQVVSQKNLVSEEKKTKPQQKETKSIKSPWLLLNSFLTDNPFTFGH